MFFLISLLLVCGCCRANYDCLCSYNVEKPVLNSPTPPSSTIGYMYEFDCKPVIKVSDVDETVWGTIAFENQQGYIKMDQQLKTQVCPGDPSPTDLSSHMCCNVKFCADAPADLSLSWAAIAEVTTQSPSIITTPSQTPKSSSRSTKQSISSTTQIKSTSSTINMSSVPTKSTPSTARVTTPTTQSITNPPITSLTLPTTKQITSSRSTGRTTTYTTKPTSTTASTGRSSISSTKTSTISSPTTRTTTPTTTTRPTTGAKTPTTTQTASTRPTTITTSTTTKPITSTRPTTITTSTTTKPITTPRLPTAITTGTTSKPITTTRPTTGTIPATTYTTTTRPTSITTRSSTKSTTTTTRPTRRTTMKTTKSAMSSQPTTRTSTATTATTTTRPTTITTTQTTKSTTTSRQTTPTTTATTRPTTTTQPTTKTTTLTTKLTTTTRPTTRMTTQTTTPTPTTTRHTVPVMTSSVMLGNTSLCSSSVVQYAKEDNEILTQRGSNCYTVVPHMVSWSQAEFICNKRGGHLFHVTDQTENLFFYILLNSRFNYSVWMGLHDTVIEEHFQWTSGVPVTFTNWTPGRQSNFADHNIEDCAVFVPYLDHGHWDDVPCGVTSPMFGRLEPLNYFICQFPIHKPRPMPQSGHFELCPDHLEGHIAQYDKSCYERVSRRQTWNAAEQDCRRKGGHLLQIGSSEEESFIQRFLTLVSQHAVWIGLHDQGHEEKFTWTSGERLTYTNWMFGRKNVYFHGIENCVLFLPYNGQWDDVPCGFVNYRKPLEVHSYICEYHIVPSAGTGGVLIGK